MTSAVHCMNADAMLLFAGRTAHHHHHHRCGRSRCLPSLRKMCCVADAPPRPASAPGTAAAATTAVRVLRRHCAAAAVAAVLPVWLRPHWMMVVAHVDGAPGLQAAVERHGSSSTTPVAAVVVVVAAVAHPEAAVEIEPERALGVEKAVTVQARCSLTPSPRWTPLSSPSPTCRKARRDKQMTLHLSYGNTRNRKKKRTKKH